MCLCWWAALVSLTTALLHSVLLGTPVPQPVCSSYLSVAWWLLAEEPSCLRRRDQTSGAKDGRKRPVVYWIPVFPGRKESKLPPENEDREVEELESLRSVHVSQAALPEMGGGGGVQVHSTIDPMKISLLLQNRTFFQPGVLHKENNCACRAEEGVVACW